MESNENNQNPDSTWKSPKTLIALTALFVSLIFNATQCSKARTDYDFNVRKFVSDSMLGWHKIEKQSALDEYKINFNKKIETEISKTETEIRVLEAEMETNIKEGEKALLNGTYKVNNAKIHTELTLKIAALKNVIIKLETLKE